MKMILTVGGLAAAAILLAAECALIPAQANASTGSGSPPALASAAPRASG